MRWRIGYFLCAQLEMGRVVDCHDLDSCDAGGVSAEAGGFVVAAAIEAAPSWRLSEDAFEPL